MLGFVTGKNLITIVSHFSHNGVHSAHYLFQKALVKYPIFYIEKYVINIEFIFQRLLII